jgi:PAS domain S-box-containing protein
MMGSFVDITARKQAEADMLIARAQLEATIDAIPDLMFDMGLDGTYYDIYAQRQDLLAAPADIVLGKKVSDVLPSKAAEVVMSALREANDQGRSHGKQFELPLPQGISRFELSVSRKRAFPGQQPRFIVLSREITERKQAEKELRTSENRLKEAQRIGKLGFLDWDLATNELLLSEEAIEIYHLDKNKKVHRLDEIVNLLHPEDKERVEKSLQDAIAGIAKHDMEHRMVLPDGNVIYIRASTELFLDQNSKPVRMWELLLTSPSVSRPRRRSVIWRFMTR